MYRTSKRLLLCNKSFHAERAYPLFIISEDIETGIEKNSDRDHIAYG